MEASDAQSLSVSDALEPVEDTLHVGSLWQQIALRRDENYRVGANEVTNAREEGAVDIEYINEFQNEYFTPPKVDELVTELFWRKQLAFFLALALLLLLHFDARIGADTIRRFLNDLLLLLSSLLLLLRRT